MVYEVGLDGEILHLKDITPPQDPFKVSHSKPTAKGPDAADAGASQATPAAEAPTAETSAAATPAESPVATPGPAIPEPAITADETVKDADDGPAEGDDAVDPVEELEEAVAPAEPDNLDLPELLRFDPAPQWPTDTTRALLQLLPAEKIVNLHDLFLQGRTPPKPSPNDIPPSTLAPGLSAEEAAMSGDVLDNAAGARGQGRDRGRGRNTRDRGGRGGRGRRGGRNGAGVGGSYGERVEDPREVQSEVRLHALTV